MAEKTESKETVSREELAQYFRELADEFASEGEANLRIGNKSVTMYPPERIKREIEVVERSSVLRGDKESLGLEISWKSKGGN